jgi:hypothetical protein
MHETDDHVCTCTNCKPDLIVVGPEDGLPYVAVRFWGDASRTDEEGRETKDGTSASNWRILLDDVPVDDVFEAVLGDPGIIWSYQRNDLGYLHICQTCMDKASSERRYTKESEYNRVPTCSTKRTGRVELKLIGSDEAATY